MTTYIPDDVKELLLIFRYDDICGYVFLSTYLLKIHPEIFIDEIICYSGFSSK